MDGEVLGWSGNVKVGAGVAVGANLEAGAILFNY